MLSRRPSITLNLAGFSTSIVNSPLKNPLLMPTRPRCIAAEHMLLSLPYALWCCSESTLRWDSVLGISSLTSTGQIIALTSGLAPLGILLWIYGTDKAETHEN